MDSTVVAALHQVHAWMVASSRLTDGISFESSLRNRTAGSLLHLCVEHHQSIFVLVDHGLLGSAIALLRPQFEALVRGIWCYECSTDKQLESFVEEGKIPTLELMVTAICKLPAYEDGALHETKKQVGKALNDFTHGGSKQIQARWSGNEISSNHSPEFICGVLRWASIMSYMSSLSMSTLCNDSLLANALRQEFFQIYKRDESTKTNIEPA